MKSSFLKGFFNSKDSSSKSNFNIHNVDLDESDDVIVCNESFFQRNNSPLESNNSKSMYNKHDDMFYKKKFNIYSFNDSTSSSNNDVKSPTNLKEFNFSKLKNSPLNINNEKLNKNKNLEFLTPNLFGALKTPTKEPKLTNFDMVYKSNIKNLSSPTILSKGFITKSYDQNKDFKDEKLRSPNNTKVQFSPRKFIDSGQEKISFENKFLNENVKMLSNDISPYREKKSDNFYSNININNKSFDEKFHSKKGSESLDNITFMNDDKKSDENEILNMNEFINDGEDDKLKVLHHKLKIEADKIQKWKENTEKDLSLKIQKLNESEKIIESLRASNLDFQMQQENISLNYQEELDCRSEVTKKIENSRNLCQILKQKIENIEKMNQNNVNESQNIRLTQEKLLYSVNYFMEDLWSFSETQITCLHKLKNQVFLKVSEIKELNDVITKLKDDYHIEINKYKNEIKDIENQLTMEKEKVKNQIDENKNILFAKDQIENAWVNEKHANQQLKSDKDKVFQEFCDLEISIKKLEENNNTLSKEIENKEILIISSNENLIQFEKNHLNFQESTTNEILILKNALVEKDNFITTSKGTISKLEDEIKDLQFSSESMKNNLYSKIQIKENSIESLTTMLIEKEVNTSNLENSIEKVNVLLKDAENNLLKLQLENDSNIKNISILKSSNSDLREELDNQSLEIKNLRVEINERNIQLENLKAEILNKIKEKEDNENLILELKNENSALNEDLELLRKNILDIQTKNDELQISSLNFQELYKSMLNEKESLTCEFHDTINNMQLQQNQMILEIKNKDNSIELLNNNIQTLSEDNKILSKTAEEFQSLLNLNENNLSSEVYEKEKLTNKNKADNEKMKIYEEKIKEFENLLSENKYKLSSLEIFIDDLSKEKQNILKSREDLRKELMLTLEQCKNENEIIERKKNKEIENLKLLVNSLTLDSQSNSKKSKTKLIDLTNQLVNQKEEIEKLEIIVKDTSNEKENTKKFLYKANSSINELSEKTNELEIKLNELNNEKKQHAIQTLNYDNKLSILSKEIEEKNFIISRLNIIEIEHNELKHKLITNSPPMCTQIPDYIKRSGEATPKSQRLSSKLESFSDIHNLNENITIGKQTPQKTPKGILRQPGSASKRRKVIFNENDLIQSAIEISDNESTHSYGIDIDLEDISYENFESKSNFENISNNLNFVTTPKKHSLTNKLSLSDSKSGGRLTNIRKTPSKASTKLNDRRKKNKENWFDSDNFFGVGVEA